MALVEAAIDKRAARHGRACAAIVLCVTAGAALCGTAGCSSEAEAAPGRKRGRMLVIGMDGVDPRILGRLMDEGKAPNFKAVAAQGAFRPLATSNPPQSPVAWSNFISGAEPGTHQIYDFIHRTNDLTKPGSAPRPDFSTSTVRRTELPRWLGFLPPQLPWSGEYQIPLVGQEHVSLRKGERFWDYLVAAGIETSVFRVPANFPPDDPRGGWLTRWRRGRFESISGMGTPDLHGSYGEFFKFGENIPLRGRDAGSGRFRNLTFVDHRARGVLEGPGNFLIRPDKKKYSRQPGDVPGLEAPFDVVRDPEAPVLKIILGDAVALLSEGEWSEWMPVVFDTHAPQAWVLGALGVPTKLDATVRFYARSARPGKTELYVTPLNIDPVKPANAISVPGSAAADVAEHCGRFYTTGIPEDTKALRSNALNEDEFLAQARLVLDERIRHYRYALETFERGFMFFYFGSTDQLAHIFWRDRDPPHGDDPGHPGLKPGEAEKYGRVVEDLYVEMDGLVGDARQRLGPDDVLMVISDHGFDSFRYGFNVNTWLVRNGYMELLDPDKTQAGLSDVNWNKTVAYAVGINAVYINEKGREAGGIVTRGPERTRVMREIADKIVQFRDLDGAPVIDKVFIVDDVYPGADPAVAPDLLIGYAHNYRSSWDTALGGISSEMVEDNLDRWSGDHMNSADLVPGILVVNRPVTLDDPALSDVGPSILRYFGVTPPAQMSGRPFLAP